MDEMRMLATGTHVIIDGVHGGVIIGHGSMERDGWNSNRHSVPVYLVELSIGGWEENRRFFTSVTVAHPDSVEETR